MKHTRFLFTIILLIAFTSSCSKEDPTNLIETWEAYEATRSDSDITYPATGAINFYDDGDKILSIGDVKVELQESESGSFFDVINFVGQQKDNELYDLNNNQELLGYFDMGSLTLTYIMNEDYVYIVKFRKNTVLE